MTTKVWPQRDARWLGLYRGSIAGKPVPRDVAEARERELLVAVLEAEAPADEVLGDPAELAALDATELAGGEEELIREDGGTPRTTVINVGGTGLAIGLVVSISMLVRSGWSLDVNLAVILVGGGTAVAFIAWAVASGCYGGGRLGGVFAAIVLGVVAGSGGIVMAVLVGNDHVLVRDVPTLLVGAALLMPGVALLIIGGNLRERLQEDWSDGEWLQRFRNGLRTRLLPAEAARGHIAEVVQTIARGGDGSANREFGHPLVYARALAQANRHSRGRRWWVSAVGTIGWPLAFLALMLLIDTGSALRIPFAVLFGLGAVAGTAALWPTRPWKRP